MKSLTQMLSLRMDEQKTEQLKTMLGICQELGAETRYYPEHRYFTAMVWTGWVRPAEWVRPCHPTGNSKNSRSVPGRRVLLLRPIQHTGLHGLSQVW